MERNRNLLGWAALILAGLALVVALAGRGPFGRWDRFDRVVVAPVAPAAPMAPEEEMLRGMPGSPVRPDIDQDIRQELERSFRQHGRGHGPMHGFGYDGPRHGFGGWLFGPLMLLKGLAQLVALGMLAWLLLRLFSQRRNPPAAPTTPAGHDPRVE